MAVEEHRSRGFSRDLVLRVAVVLTVAAGAAAWFLLGGNVRPLDPPAGGDEPIGTTVVRSGPVVPGAISDGLVRVGFADFDLDEGMAVDMRFPVPEAGQGGSQTFALGWWLRSDGDVDLQPQPVPTATSYVDDTAWFRFGPVGADGIEAELVVVARDTSASEDDGHRCSSARRSRRVAHSGLLSPSPRLAGVAGHRAIFLTGEHPVGRVAAAAVLQARDDRHGAGDPGQSAGSVGLNVLSHSPPTGMLV
jgi:hypothetical protein